MKKEEGIPREILMYNRDRRFKNALAGVPEWEANEEDKELVFRFIKKLDAQDLTYGRKEKYLYYLKWLCKWSKELEFKFKDATEDNIVELAGLINKTDYSDETKSGFKITIKRFYLEVLEKERSELIDWMYSKRCRALRGSNGKSKERINKQPYTREDIAKIINNADVMMKALVSVAFEGCLRPAEYIMAEISQLQDQVECYQLQIVGKTGRRYIYLVDSLPYIKEWIEIRPKNNKYLFCENGSFLQKRTIDNRFRILCEKANVDKNKPCYLYWLRHSGVTHKRVLGYSDEIIIKYAGWTSGRQLKTYSHVTTEYKNEILKRAGLKPNEKEIEAIKICPRCGFNEIGFSESYCPKCKTVLNVEEYQKQLEKQTMIEQVWKKIAEKYIDYDKLGKDKEALEIFSKIIN